MDFGVGRIFGATHLITADHLQLATERAALQHATAGIAQAQMSPVSGDDLSIEFQGSPDSGWK